MSLEDRAPPNQPILGQPTPGQPVPGAPARLSSPLVNLLFMILAVLPAGVMLYVFRENRWWPRR